MGAFSIIQKLKDIIADYIKVKIDIIKLDFTEHLSNILAILIAYTIIGVMGLLVVIFLSIGLSIYLNSVLDSLFLGYFVVAGIFIIKLIFIYFLLQSGRLKSFFESKLIKDIQEMDTNEEEDEE